MKKITIDGKRLNLKTLKLVAENRASISLSAQAIPAIKRCHDFVESLVEQEKTVYGITTGFGEMAKVTVPKEKAGALQENLIRSHACGAGSPLPQEVVRAMILLRANSLCHGNSGIRPQIIDALLGLLNANVLPVVPSQGSVGASGDLAPLSHIALALLGEGKFTHNGQAIDNETALAKAGFAPFKLKAKEGLALINGTQMMNSILALALWDCYCLLDVAHLGAALSTQALLATDAPFDPMIHNCRPHPGQMASAQTMMALLKDSPLIESHKNCEKVQDAYSIRCIPQVHGASWATFDYAASICRIEMNSVTDNPLIFPQDEKAISGGNFHGQPIALALDFVAIAAAELGSIAERRIERLVNPALSNGLPPFLATDGGVESGLMIAQYLAAALVSENKINASPASVDSIPTSGNQEDHVSMGSVGALKLLRLVENLKSILAIEWLCAARGIQFRKMASSHPCELILKKIYPIIGEVPVDMPLTQPISEIVKLIESEIASNTVNRFAGHRAVNWGQTDIEKD